MVVLTQNRRGRRTRSGETARGPSAADDADLDEGAAARAATDLDRRLVRAWIEVRNFGKSEVHQWVPDRRRCENAASAIVSGRDGKAGIQTAKP
jgi:hypothetical protein